MREGDQPAASLRLGWLDALKGVAILWILAGHIYVRDGGAISFHLRTIGSLTEFLPQGNGWNWALDLFTHPFLAAGYQGVHLFFAASGFALTYGLFKQSAPVNWGPWLRRRLVRLLPMYWIAHLFFWVVCWVRQDWSPMPLDLRAVASLLTVNWAVPGWFWYAPDAWWFVRVLLQFYLIFPLLYGLLLRLGAERFLLVCAVVTVACRLGYLAFFLDYHPDAFNFGFAPNRLFEFALGMACCQALLKGKALIPCSWRSAVLLGGCWVCGTALSSVYWGKVFSEALIGLGSFGLLSMVLSHFHYPDWVGKPLRWIGAHYPDWVGKPLRWIGVHSYGLYLIHGPLIPPVRSMFASLSAGLPFVGWLGSMASITIAGCLFDLAVAGGLNRYTVRPLRSHPT